MRRQTILGFLFLLVGLAIIAVVLAPVVVTLIRSAPPPAISLALLLTGVGLALFGAWLLPSSGVPATFTQITIALENSSLPIVGGKRKGDPQPPKDGAP